MKNYIFNKYKIIFDANRINLLKDNKIVTNYSRVPKSVIYKICDYFSIHVRGEVCMYTGRISYKVCKIINEQGGVVTLYSNYSKAKINKFIINYNGV